MQELKGNIAERVASAFNDQDPRMKRWACMSAERRRQYVLRWERRLQAIRDAGFEVVEVAEVERLAMDAKSLEGIIDSLERRMDGPNGLLAKVVRLTRERDEARAEVERQRADARAIATIAHTGGTAGLSEREALVEIRRRTLKAWDSKTSRAALEAKP